MILARHLSRVVFMRIMAVALVLGGLALALDLVESAAVVLDASDDTGSALSSVLNVELAAMIRCADGVARSPDGEEVRQVPQRHVWTTQTWISRSGSVWKRYYNAPLGK